VSNPEREANSETTQVEEKVHCYCVISEVDGVDHVKESRDVIPELSQKHDIGLLNFKRHN